MWWGQMTESNDEDEQQRREC